MSVSCVWMLYIILRGESRCRRVCTGERHFMCASCYMNIMRHCLSRIWILCVTLCACHMSSWCVWVRVRDIHEYYVSLYVRVMYMCLSRIWILCTIWRGGSSVCCVYEGVTNMNIVHHLKRRVMCVLHIWGCYVHGYGAGRLRWVRSLKL